MDITPDKVLEIQQYAREPISLDQTIGDEGDSQLGDFIEDSEAVVAVDAVSLHPAAGPAAVGAADAVRAGGRRGPAALRPHRRPAAHPGRDRPGLRRDPRADPPDRVQDDVEAAPPVAAPRCCATTWTRSTPLTIAANPFRLAAISLSGKGNPIVRVPRIKGPCQRRRHRWTVNS